jgi:PAS domain S-box-containing protein
MNLRQATQKISQLFQFDLTISQKGLVLVFVPITLALLFIVSLGILLGQAQSDIWREADARMLASNVTSIGRHFLDASQYLFRYTMTRNPAQRDDAENETELMVKDIESIRELSVDSARQVENVSKLEHIINDGMHVFESLLTVVDEKNASLISAHRKGSSQRDITALLDRLSYYARTIVDEEQRELNQTTLASSRARELAVNWLYAGVFFAVLLAFSMAVFFSKGITQRFATLVENSLRLGKRKPLLSPLKGADEIAALDHAFHDMAETLADLARKERAVVDNAVDVICSVDESGRFLSVNQASVKAWGYEPDELVGQQITNIVLESDRERTLSAVKDLIGSKVNKLIENHITRKDGGIVEALWSATFSAKENALFCVVHDITQRKEVERMKQEFLAMVSHDLRTPLTSIQFSLHIILSESPNNLEPEVLEEIKAAERNCNNLIDLINSLLDVEKIESGKLDLDLAPMKVANLISRAHDAVSAFAIRNGVVLDFHQSDLEIVADEDRLLQVLVNLLSNAIKFSPKGGTVTLAIDSVPPCLEFAVTDEGPGIPDDYKAAIFDRFEQVKMSKYKRKGGTGLGLAICRAVVLAHSGEIGVRSKEGEGSTFWFKIPSKEPVALTSE